MKHIFYLIGVYFVLYELLWVISPQDQVDKAKKAEKLNKDFKGKKSCEWSEEYKDLVYKNIVNFVFVFGWIIMGLFTFQWIIFLFKLAFYFIIIHPISRLTKYSLAYTILHWINSLIGLVLALFIIINAYHLKINVTEIFFNLIGV